MKPACNVATLIERYFTDRLMREIARLSEREYVDEYVPPRAPAAAA